ncbi:glycine betaine/L-proline ABC transporter permease ProW [Aeromonas simiae]|uniref:Glycine betaine/L-proline ABC transporter permease ProW n=1 Tax=Aeromonas simiae TaxID=218936 RepID=A0A5J6WRB9_9GAMM|nr:glycine betaine/L-proline ABC transporter permease ProW [Aeromonas simiae]QFI53659.1 glycine betaine/L-proline ABC transporter permease ProW [Aeromonas simiae]
MLRTLTLLTLIVGLALTLFPPYVTAADAPLAATQHNEDPWGSAPEAAPVAEWTQQIAAPEPAKPLDLLRPFEQARLPLDRWAEQGIAALVEHGRPLFLLVRAPVEAILGGMIKGLQAIPATLMIATLGLLAWQWVSGPMAIGILAALTGIGLIGAWSDAMVTLALVLTSLFFCLLIGLPLGILLARSERAGRWVQPLLDAMQTTPAFVYLIPIVMLFGIGNVPGVVVTIIFALPPLVRLTMLGIRQVPADLVEAAHSFGANPRQLLFKVQLPLAMPTLMAGVNQCLMLSLSMVVIASMIAVGGLGQQVLRGIGRLDMGMAAIGGVGIVLLAIVLDRLTQALGRNPRQQGSWRSRGPAALLRRLSHKAHPARHQGVEV